MCIIHPYGPSRVLCVRGIIMLLCKSDYSFPLCVCEVSENGEIWIRERERGTSLVHHAIDKSCLALVPLCKTLIAMINLC